MTFFQNKALFDNFRMMFPHRRDIARNGRVQYLRGFINFGAPLNINGIEYNDLTDRQDDQKQFVADFQKEIYDKLLEMKDTQPDSIVADIFSEQVA